MKLRQISYLLLGALPARVLTADIIKTDGFSTCLANSDITVNNVDVQYDKGSNKVTFDVSGSSAKSQKVMASLIVTAYGRNVFQKDFDPCDKDNLVEQLCPVPQGNFAAKGQQSIPESYAGMIPAIAFSVPDLDGQAKLELKAADSGKKLACIESHVNNGKTANVPAVAYIAAGIAGAALILSGVSALGSSASGAGTAVPSPTFFETFTWFQSIATNGMLSVDYPPVYRSFAKNFAFSGGLIPWTQMQENIDSFRNKTGGNLTTDSVEYLRNATLVYNEGSDGSNMTKRALDFASDLFIRQVATTVNGTQNSTAPQSKNQHFVQGIQGYVEQLSIPRSNTFMTVLLVFAIAIAAVIVGILLFKVILETWALWGTFPKNLTGFRKRYWGLMGRTIVNMILCLYGIWTLYCVYQFVHGDSWAAKVLAGVTFAIFTVTLAVFTWKIWSLARRYKKAEGDTGALFENKDTWRRYSLFYDQYKRDYWWLFIPVIIYLFARGTIIAAGDGHGLAQVGGQLVIEAIMLIILLWSRPFATKSAFWINIFIQVVRVASVVCILLFVEQLGIAKDTKTITGVVLIAVQSVLTGVLAILIAVNFFIHCCRENPHHRQRKEAEKAAKALSPPPESDPRHSLLMDQTAYRSPGEGMKKGPETYDRRVSSSSSVPQTRGGYETVPQHNREGSGDYLTHGRTYSGSYQGQAPPAPYQQPTLPFVGGGGHAPYRV